MLIFLPGVALLSPLADPSSSTFSLKITILLLFSPDLPSEGLHHPQESSKGDSQVLLVRVTWAHAC